MSSPNCLTPETPGACAVLEPDMVLRLHLMRADGNGTVCMKWTSGHTETIDHAGQTLGGAEFEACPQCEARLRIALAKDGA
jgi:hypothetical protein